MAFDEIQFPFKVAAGALSGPFFSTEVVTLENGFERRNQKWSQARRRYDARTGVRGVADMMLLAAFFQARAGRARGFRLKDWSEFTSATDGVAVPSFQDQVMGVGDGVKTTFQLCKSYGWGDVKNSRVIRKPVSGSVVVGVDGVERTSGWSCDFTSGLVTFGEAPLLGEEITAGFVFDVPVRFDVDHLVWVSEDDRQAKAEIPLIEVRV